MRKSRDGPITGKTLNLEWLRAKRMTGRPTGSTEGAGVIGYDPVAEGRRRREEGLEGEKNEEEGRKRKRRKGKRQWLRLGR